MGLPKIAILICSFNESKTLAKVVRDASKFGKVLVINDGSIDKTKEVLKRYKSNSFNFLSHKVNQGYGAAIKTGIKNTETKYIITVDSDGQHQLKDVINLFNITLNTSADMIVGCRPNEKKSYYRNLGKFVIRKFANLLLPNNIKDINSGMKIYKTSLAKNYIHLCPDGMSYSDTILLLFLNFKHLVLEENISLNKRENGKSTISTFTAMETLLQILNITVLFKPLKVFGLISLSILILSLLWGIPIILKGNGISAGTLLGVLTSIIVFSIGLLVEQVTEIRKNQK